MTWVCPPASRDRKARLLPNQSSHDRGYSFSEAAAFPIVIVRYQLFAFLALDRSRQRFIVFPMLQQLSGTRWARPPGTQEKNLDASLNFFPAVSRCTPLRTHWQ